MTARRAGRRATAPPAQDHLSPPAARGHPPRRAPTASRPPRSGSPSRSGAVACPGHPAPGRLRPARVYAHGVRARDRRGSAARPSRPPGTSPRREVSASSGVWRRDERQAEPVGTGKRVTGDRPVESVEVEEEALMSDPTRGLVRAPRVAPGGPTRSRRLARAAGGPCGPGTAPRTQGHRHEPRHPRRPGVPSYGISTPGEWIPGVPACGTPGRGSRTRTPSPPAPSGRPAAEPSAPVRPPRRPPRPPVTPPTRPPEAAAPSEDPSASGRSGESRTYAPAVTPDAPRGRDGQEGPNGRDGGPGAGDRGRRPGDDGESRRGPCRHPAPPRTAGTPRT